MPLLILWFCLTLAAMAHPQSPRVVVISIDGLRPEFYLDSNWPAPHLQSLRKNGAWAESMQSVFPSITYANHSSLVTGVSPDRHGIDCNIDFDWTSGPKLNWNWEARRLGQTALWDLTRQAGLRSCAFSWPVSVGAPIDDNVPEIFSVPGANVGSTEELLRLHSTPGLLEEIQHHHPGNFPQTFAEWDRWLPTAFAHVWRQRPADLTLIHMLNLDWTQHRFGPHSPETRQAVADLDRQLGEIMAVIRRQQDYLFVLGDHGFLEVTRNLSPNQLFYQRGWIRVKEGRVQSWKVYARSNGGSAAIYCKDPKLEAAVQRLLEGYQPTYWTLLSASELKKRKTFPFASWAISVRPGFGLTQSWEAPFEKPTERPFGQHGHLPELLPTGWLVEGPQIPPNLSIGKRHLLEVAPTVAQLLGLPHQGMELQPLELLTKGGRHPVRIQP